MNYQSNAPINVKPYSPSYMWIFVSCQNYTPLERGDFVNAAICTVIMINFG